MLRFPTLELIVIPGLPSENRRIAGLTGLALKVD
jgi:hypothetical protein